jgi:predicted nucleotidyltransferase
MDMFGRDVDFKTPASLSHYYRQEVLDEAEEIYVAP